MILLYQQRLTIPVPFQLATQRRAETFDRLHPNKDKDSHTHPAPIGARLRGRLAGLGPLRSSFLPDGVLANDKTRFKPTVPMSPKFGQRVQVRALQPSRFLLKKSTKALTQPLEFHFRSDQRSKERELFEQSIKIREHELAELRERSLRSSVVMTGTRACACVIARYGILYGMFAPRC